MSVSMLVALLSRIDQLRLRVAPRLGTLPESTQDGRANLFILCPPLSRRHLVYGSSGNSPHTRRNLVEAWRHHVRASRNKAALPGDGRAFSILPARSRPPPRAPQAAAARRVARAARACYGTVHPPVLPRPRPSRTPPRPPHAHAPPPLQPPPPPRRARQAGATVLEAPSPPPRRERAVAPPLPPAPPVDITKPTDWAQKAWVEAATPRCGQ